MCAAQMTNPRLPSSARYFRPKPPSLEVGKELNRGAYGAVHSGRLDGKEVAVKRIHKLLLEAARGQGGMKDMLSNFLHECELLERVNHPHVVKFEGAYYDEATDEPILVMELMSENLRQYLERKRGKLSHKEQLDICVSIVRGLRFLHTRTPPIVHRDLTDKNILLDANEAVKISDLGQSRLKTAEYFSTGQPGAIPFMSPEAMQELSHYNEKLDMFSLGVLMLEVATQQPPRVSMVGIGVTPELQRRKGDLSKLDEGHPLHPLILSCLKDNPKERPDIVTVHTQLLAIVEGVEDVQSTASRPTQEVCNPTTGRELQALHSTPGRPTPEVCTPASGSEVFQTGQPLEDQATLHSALSVTSRKMDHNMQLGKGKTYNWKDYRMSLFGSDLEWTATLTKESAKGELAWKGAGQSVGIQIWRYAKYKVTDWPKGEYGTFFSCDTYIILNTHRKHENDEMLYDVHLYIGKYSTQQDYKTAAYKIVELATLLDDKPIQHREVMDHESDLFKSYFETIVYLEGRAHMGFHQIKPTDYTPRLLLFCGTKKMYTVREVPRNIHSLDSSCVFILDLGLKFYVWCGMNCNEVEEARAIQYAQKLKSDRAGLVTSVKVKILRNEQLSETFMTNINHIDIDEEEEVDVNDSDFMPCAMRVSNQSGTVTMSLTHRGQLPIAKTCFDPWSVIIIDTGKCLYVWTSGGVSPNEKKNGLSYAHNYLMETKHPLIPVSCYVHGRETDEFWKLVAFENKGGN